MRPMFWLIFSASLLLGSTVSLQAYEDNRPVRTAVETPANAPPMKLSSPEESKRTMAAPSLLPLLGSLVLVLGVFFALVWALRRISPTSGSLLPGEAFEVLGRAPLAPRQYATLVRCGSKLLLVSLSASGPATLAEITEPGEVERLTQICRQSKPAPLQRAFWQKGKSDAH